MGMFEMSDAQVPERRQQCRNLIADHVNGEEALAAAGFRQGRRLGQLRRLEGADGRSRLRRDQAAIGSATRSAPGGGRD